MRVKIALFIFVFGMAFITLVMHNYGFDSVEIDSFLIFLMPFGIGFIFSVLIGNILERLSGNFFKKNYLSLPFGKYRLNIPLFFVIVILLKAVFLRVILERVRII